MKIRAYEIYEAFKQSGLISDLIGPDVEIMGISPAESGKKGDLVFVDRKDFVETVMANSPSAIITTPELESEFFNQTSMTRLLTRSVNLALALVRQRFDDRNPADEDWTGIDKRAVIHSAAKISETATIGPGAVIGSGCVVGQNCVIMANSVIEHGVIIGDGTVIHPSVTIGYNTQIGKNTIIRSGTVVGSEGYGFAQDEKRRSYRIPQTGRVVIEDDVVIGANCCIDRATFNETRIRRGTKLDNLCHVAHNVDIGEDCLLTAGFIVAGSTKIGNRVITSGQTGILDHLNIADDTVFLHRAGVTDNVTQPGAYAGLPLQPLNEYMKNMALVKKLTEMRKTIRNLEKKIDPGE